MCVFMYLMQQNLFLVYLCIFYFRQKYSDYTPAARLGKLASAVREAGVSQLRAPLKPLNTIECRDATEGFQGGLSIGPGGRR